MLTLIVRMEVFYMTEWRKVRIAQKENEKKKKNLFRFAKFDTSCP